MHNVVPYTGPLAVVEASHAHVEPTLRAIRACTAMMYRLDIAQWDDEYPSGGVIATAVENRSLFLFVRDGTVVVGAGLDTVQPPEYQLCDWRYGASALVVHHLFVHPEYWRMGYASRYMEFAEQHAATMHVNAIRLDAYAGNPAALSLYRSRGYREAGEVMFPRRSCPFICFEKNLD